MTAMLVVKMLSLDKYHFKQKYSRVITRRSYLYLLAGRISCQLLILPLVALMLIPRTRTCLLCSLPQPHKMSHQGPVSVMVTPSAQDVQINLDSSLLSETRNMEVHSLWEQMIIESYSNLKDAGIQTS